jgi:Putative zinc-finger
MPYDVNHVLKHADVAGWALGALDPIDAQAFEAHLRSCGQCQAAVAEFEPVAKALGRAAPPVEPPDDLEARTIARVLAAAAEDQSATKVQRIPGAFRAAGEDQDANPVRPIPDLFRPAAVPGPRREDPVPAGPEGPEHGEHPRTGAKVIRLPRWHGRGRLVAVTSAVAGAVAAAVIAFLVIAPGGGHGLPANAVAFTLSSPSGQTASATATDLPDASGSWDVTLTVRHLPVLPGEDYYECWYVRPAQAGGHPQYASAGTFVVEQDGSRTFSMTSGVDPREFSRMEIHAESPGATGPQGAAILSGTART